MSTSTRLRMSWWRVTSISFRTTWSVRNNRSSMVMFCLTAYEAPYKLRRRYPDRYSAASRRVLLGIVPVLMQTPPMTVLRSTMATRLLSLAAWMAARCPAGPEPMTTMSYVKSDISPSEFKCKPLTADRQERRHEEVRPRVRSAAGRLLLAPYLQHDPAKLSGTQRQRMAVAP